MIRISQLKLPVGHGPEELRRKAARELRIPEERIEKLKIEKQSIDARTKPIQYVYTLGIQVRGEGQVLKHCRSRNVSPAEEKHYHFPKPGEEPLAARPVIVGCGPAGLFCGLMLARAGYRPILLERGEEARVRQKRVDHFWATGELAPDSNVQFGEGGAGTFSDGKLNTLVKDPKRRGHLVLETFVEAGAPEEILYQNKPHLGTDVLTGVVEHIREEICSLGGEVHFRAKLTGLDLKQGRIAGVWYEQRKPRGYSEQDKQTGACEQNKQNGRSEQNYLAAQVLVLAIGHSARDTFRLLKEQGIPMEQKAFAVGVRIEHPQELVNLSQYGENYPNELPAAAYKVTRHVGDRGVYSFCMCPGGYVVNASSEPDLLAVNGMSYQARDGHNANSAMIVTVRPEDFGSTDVLAGVEFQRRLERSAYRAGESKVPVQLLGDFCKKQLSRSLGEVEPCIRGRWQFGDVRSIFPEELSAALEEGIQGCEQLIAGFSRSDALLSGVESRTSSPVRILRGDTLESVGAEGLYPCGEGAGYAGGITSAAMDGIKVAEAIAGRYRRLS